MTLFSHHIISSQHLTRAYCNSTAKTSYSYWQDKTNQRIFFDQLANKLGIKSQEDWYRVTKKQVEDNGGQELLSYYQYSPIRALESLYPEYEWISWSFDTAM